MWIIDTFDRAISLPFPEFRNIPPNRYRIRVGVGNQLFFNQPHFIRYGLETWLEFFSRSLVTTSSHIVDIGCGCGRAAYGLRNLSKFTGLYCGIDIDKEMIEWCSSNFRDDRFKFIHADIYNSVYNPNGRRGQYKIPLPDQSQDFVFSQSLFTHLLEDDLINYVQEAFRLSKPNGKICMSVFCLDDMKEIDILGNRWTFQHRIGYDATVESLKYPEAAVAYSRDFLLSVAEKAGFKRVEIEPTSPQSLLLGSR
jgi:SAM-dependent methyltransferase